MRRALRVIAGGALACGAAAMLALALWPAPVSHALEEESVPAGEMPSPSATPSPGTGAETTLPPTSVTPETGGEGAEVSPVAAPTPEASPSQAAEIFPEPTPLPTPSGEPTPFDLGTVTPSPEVSDQSLQPLIDRAETPARAASLRIVEQGRLSIVAGDTDSAIRDLAQASSIDPANPYAYFFLGRAYLTKKNYTQALIFFKRAEIGFGANPVWLGETLAFEGLDYEESGHLVAGEAAYQQALDAMPGNLMARVGYTRLSSMLQSQQGESNPETPGGAPASPGSALQPPPAEPPPPPPPAVPPPAPPPEE
jgi:hypothetical protein